MIRLLELIAVGVVAALLSIYGTLRYVQRETLHSFGPEVAFLAKTYGPGRSSYGAEEWVARHFFQDRRGGVFLDVGAGDPEIGSNTVYLERKLGWSGVAIDAQANYAAAYRKARPRTQFVNAFVADKDDGAAVLHQVVGRPDIASGVAEFSRRWGDTTAAQVPTTTLTSTLDRLGVQRVNFLSLDIELFEPMALAGFDLERFRPDLVCVESHQEVRQALIDYFTDRRYVLVGTYLRLDAQNLYFAPRGSPFPKFPASIYGTWRTREHG
jgi:FkbM family methyltransferase